MFTLLKRASLGRSVRRPTMSKGPEPVPFLLRFAERPAVPHGGGETLSGTRETKVSRETTDDD
jgi:hypothetical protein